MISYITPQASNYRMLTNILHTCTNICVFFYYYPNKSSDDLFSSFMITICFHIRRVFCIIKHNYTHLNEPFLFLCHYLSSFVRFGSLIAYLLNFFFFFSTSFRHKKKLNIEDLSVEKINRSKQVIIQNKRNL
jgi:hypothetical protein